MDADVVFCLGMVSGALAMGVALFLIDPWGWPSAGRGERNGDGGSPPSRPGRPDAAGATISPPVDWEHVSGLDRREGAGIRSREGGS